MEYYSQYEFIRPSPADSQAQDTSDTQAIVSAAVKTLTNTMAVLLNRQPPTPAEVEMVAHQEKRRSLAGVAISNSKTQMVVPN